MEIRKIKIADYDYPLPDGRIALHPLPVRDSCKLLMANAAGRVSHHVFSDLPILLRPDTLLVANETKVIRARLEFMKPSGARIEIFLLEPLAPRDYVTSFASSRSCSWVCLVGNRKRWKEGPLTQELRVEGEDAPVVLSARMGDWHDGSSVEVIFSWDNPSLTFAEIVERAGNIPIPPYLNRKSEETDNTDYQTVYSRVEGSVAAPTAGLHFTSELIENLRRYGDDMISVTLHVGAGTFQPVKSEEIGEHPMHTEWISVSRATLRRLVSALEQGRDILAVGTTSVRTLESLPYLGVIAAETGKIGSVTQWMPYEPKYSRIDTVRALKCLIKHLDANGLDSLETTTAIMIAPGFRWRIVNRLVTNFHQPKSTLLLLVSSFLGNDGSGRERWKEIYREALEKDYRFLSYGDACLFSRGRQPVELPLSKSIFLRKAMIMALEGPEALGSLPLTGLCDDSEYFAEALRQVWRSVREGVTADIYIGEGAAPLRFLTAFAASLEGASVRITCGGRLPERPLKPLIEALRSMGAEIELDDSPTGWLLKIRGKKLKGGPVEVDTAQTSQFLSALMLASPLWEAPAEFITEKSVSAPYVRMTEELMANTDHPFEPDWSAAAFFYEYALITGREVLIGSLTGPALSLQGDSACADIFARFGVETKFNPDGSAALRCDKNFLEGLDREEAVALDFSDTPDLLPAIAVALCHRRIPFSFTGIGHLKYKESDRVAALQSVLVRIGYEVSREGGKLEFSGRFHPLNEFPLEVEAYGDHRMAMALYPLELAGMVRIEDKGVVSKSFPDFYQQF